MIILSILAPMIMLFIQMLMKKLDEQYDLPNMKYYIYIMVAITCAGYIHLAKPSFVECLINVLSIGVLGYMAYMDHKTGTLYSCISIFYGTVGFLLMIANGDFLNKISILLIEVAFIFFMYLSKVMNSGDVELMIGILPYLMWGDFSIFKFLLFVTISLGISIVTNLIKFLKTKQKNYPFAPAIYAAYIAMIVFIKN